MKNSEGALHHLIPGQESRGAVTVCHMRRRIGSAPLRHPLVPGKRNPPVPQSLLQEKPREAIPGQLSFRDIVSEQQMVAYEPYSHQL